MKIPIPRIYDQVMDLIAIILFPSRKYSNLTLGIYTIAMAGGLWWYYNHWLWAVAVLLCAAMAYMIVEWW